MNHISPPPEPLIRDIPLGRLALAPENVRKTLPDPQADAALKASIAAPELLDAYRADEIDLEVLKAFSVTTDHDRQRAVWEQVSAQGYRPTAWQVKRMLSEERVPAGSPMARFVGVDAYEVAGGPVLRDLFADEYENGVWLEDPALLIELAMKKLQAAADELSTRWKWAEAMADVDWSATAPFGRIQPQPAEPTDAEKAEIEKLRTRHDELANMDDDEWTEALVEEAEGIKARLDAIEAEAEARARFKPEDFAIAGCIATIGRDGSLQVIQGLVKPEDMPKETGGDADAQDAGSADGATDTGRVDGPAMSTPTPLPKDREAEVRKEAGVGIGLADDMRSIRTALVKAHLANDFEAAFDLMVFQLVRAVFAQGYTASWHALDIAFNETADRPTTRTISRTVRTLAPGNFGNADRGADRRFRPPRGPTAPHDSLGDRTDTRRCWRGCGQDRHLDADSWRRAMTSPLVRIVTGLVGLVLLASFVLGLSHSISTGFAGFWGGLPFMIITIGVLVLAAYDYWDQCLRRTRFSANFLLDKWVRTHWTNYALGCEEAGRVANPQDWRVARSIFVHDDHKTALDYGKDNARSPYRYYFNQLFTKLKKANRHAAFKPRPDFPDDKLTLDFIVDSLVIAGDPSSVVDQLLAFRVVTGDFGTLLYAGKDWEDRSLGIRSMELMAEKVMPEVNAAIGGSEATEQGFRGAISGGDSRDRSPRP